MSGSRPMSARSLPRPPHRIAVCGGWGASGGRETGARGSLGLEAEEDAGRAEDVAVAVGEELDLVQVGGQVVGHLVLLPRRAAVGRLEDGAAAADGPRVLAVGQEGDVEEAVATGADLELVEGDGDL